MSEILVMQPPVLKKVSSFQLLRELGRGGMGIVYESVDELLNRPVAIKVLSPRTSGPDPDWPFLQQRLIKEAQSAALLAHPNIVSVYKAGIDQDNAFIEMELVVGETLEARAARQELSWEESVWVLQQLALALDYAHSKGVIHRDVKPANVMLCEDGATKLMDFGIAKLADELLQYASDMTGSPQFMSPEQLKNEVVTPASDQYGLAAIAYWLLTGAHTFTAMSLAQLSYRVLFEPVVPAHVHNPQLDLSVHDILRKALSKSPEDRFPNCQAFVVALEERLFAPPTEAPIQSHRLEVTSVPPRQSVFTRNPFWSGFLFALLVVGAAFLLYFRNR